MDIKYSIDEKIWKTQEYDYPAAYGFVPNIKGYIHEDNEKHPCMIVVPGGGYCMVVNCEGEPVAKEFYDAGMNVFILTYTTDITMSVPLHRQPLEDISRAVRYIRKNSERFHILPNKVIVCGFSAGGHLCASLCTHHKDIEDMDTGYSDISNKPDAAILSYPVITTGEYTHIYSVQTLLGINPDKEELDYYSLEKHVSKDTPPCFVWQTVEDDLVPVENSILFAESLRKNNIKYAYYAFPHGRHGLSAANESFEQGDFGEEYTFEQVNLAIKNVKDNTAINVSTERREELLKQFGIDDEVGDINPETPEEKMIIYDDVKLWPNLAKIWLKEILSI